jgi:hypothetical protein
VCSTSFGTGEGGAFGSGEVVLKKSVGRLFWFRVSVEMAVSEVAVSNICRWWNLRRRIARQSSHSSDLGLEASWQGQPAIGPCGRLRFESGRTLLWVEGFGKPGMLRIGPTAPRFCHGQRGPRTGRSGPRASEARPRAQGPRWGAQGGRGRVRGCSSTASLSLPPKTPYRKKDIGGSEVPVPQGLPLTPLSSRLILRKFAPGKFPRAVRRLYPSFLLTPLRHRGDRGDREIGRFPRLSSAPMSPPISE